MNATKRIIIFLLTLAAIAGIGYALYPVGKNLLWKYESKEAVESFTYKTEILPDVTEVILSANKEALPPYYDLLCDMQAYNERIYSEAQAGLDAKEAYQAAALDLADYGLDDGIIGVISIPSINIEMPLYLGASSENMAKGAVVLGQTSLPIGGKNTNSVIAGHRGWSGADYFRYLDKIQVGDTVTVTNLWEKLTYHVTEIAVIQPNDIDAIKIQDGKDLLSLITCHPYASGGRYRLVVYCERSSE